MKMKLESALKNPKIETMELEVTGLSPLLVQNWSSKVHQPTGCCYGRKSRSNKERMFHGFLDSLYIIDRSKLPRRPIGPGESWSFIKGAFGIPLEMFRRPLASTARLLGHDSAFTLKEGLAPIRYSRLVCHASSVQVGIGPKKAHDVRIRGRFEDWSVRIKVRFDSNRISGKEVLAIIRAAGNFSGVGAWRPEIGGNYGRFKAAPAMKSV